MGGAWHGVWLDSRLTHLAARLWAVLSLECDVESFSCRIKTRLAAKALRTSAENIEAALDQLQTCGYVTIERESKLLHITLTAEQWGDRVKNEAMSLV